MKIVEPVTYSSLSELKSDLETIKEKYISDSIVLIRGLKLTKDEHLGLVKDLGDLMGWTPNTKTNFNHRYDESHSWNDKLANSLGEDIILGWHLEHIDYDKFTPLVAGVWNMQKFNCSPDVGMTYFMDSRKLYNLLFNEEEKSFLRDCWAEWEENYHQTTIKNSAKLVSNHWITGEELIRLEMHHLPPILKLSTYQDRAPKEEESKYFEELINRFISEHYLNEDLRIVQKWNEGDILIPDLHCLAHAVTGGFASEDREFTGLWCYLNYPENLETASVHPSWR